MADHELNPETKKLERLRAPTSAARKVNGVHSDLAHHQARHIYLHAALDELAADFLRHQPQELLCTASIMDLIEWSYEQTQRPTNPGFI